MISLVLLVVIGAVILSLVEDLSLGNSVYLSFITAFTIGYGDITPATTIGRILSVASVTMPSCPSEPHTTPSRS